MEKLTKEIIGEIENYCRENIRHYEKKCQIALDYMEEMHCPLSFADSRLNDEMLELAEEWIRDNIDNLNEEDIENIMDEFDTEEVLFYTEDWHYGKDWR